MKTVVINPDTINRKWYLVDASDMILGRFSSKLATLLTGKSKTAYSPNQDHGDYVVVINADKIRLTGDKADTKVYFRHSEYPSGARYRSFKEQMALDSTKIIVDAVWGMLPKNALGRKIITKLHVYGNGEHPHAAQKPEVLSLK